jgi:hypothetical protein
VYCAAFLCGYGGRGCWLAHLNFAPFKYSSDDGGGGGGGGRDDGGGGGDDDKS